MNLKSGRYNFYLAGQNTQRMIKKEINKCKKRRKEKNVKKVLTNTEISVIILKRCGQ